MKRIVGGFGNGASLDSKALPEWVATLYLIINKYPIKKHPLTSNHSAEYQGDAVANCIEVDADIPG